MTDLQMWSLIVGFFLPVVIAVIEQETWLDWLRAIASFVVCIIAAAGTVYFNGTFVPVDLAHSFLLILVTAIATYQGLWKPTGVAPRIEHATSIVPRLRITEVPARPKP